jgi:hypothetical protein
MAKVLELVSSNTVLALDASTVTLKVLQIGVPGRDGINFSTTTLMPIASSFGSGGISGHKVVYIGSDGIDYADYRDDNKSNHVVGMTESAGVDAVNVVDQRELNGFSGLIKGDNYFLHENGAITNIAPTSNVFLHIGIATAPDKLLIKVGEPIFLS